MKAKSLIHLQLLLALSRVTSANWFMYKRPMTKFQPLLIHRQPFRTPNKLHRTEYQRYQDNGPQAVTQGWPINVCFASETQFRPIPCDTRFTTVLGQGKGPRQEISDLIYLPR